MCQLTGYLRKENVFGQLCYFDRNFFNNPSLKVQQKRRFPLDCSVNCVMAYPVVATYPHKAYCFLDATYREEIRLRIKGSSIINKTQ